MVKNLSCVSYGSLKRCPHTFTTVGSFEDPQDSRVIGDSQGGIEEALNF